MMDIGDSDRVNRCIIQEVKKRPFLYDTGHEDYLNHPIREKSWQEIADMISEILNEEVLGSTVKTRWKGLRDNCCKSFKKIKAEKAMGIYVPGKEGKYMKLLSFLFPFLLKRRFQRGKKILIPADKKEGTSNQTRDSTDHSYYEDEHDHAYYEDEHNYTENDGGDWEQDLPQMNDPINILKVKNVSDDGNNTDEDNTDEDQNDSNLETFFDSVNIKGTKRKSKQDNQKHKIFIIEKNTNDKTHKKVKIVHKPVESDDEYDNNYNSEHDSILYVRTKDAQSSNSADKRFNKMNVYVDKRPQMNEFNNTNIKNTRNPHDESNFSSNDVNNTQDIANVMSSLDENDLFMLSMSKLIKQLSFKKQIEIRRHIAMHISDEQLSEYEEKQEKRNLRNENETVNEKDNQNDEEHQDIVEEEEFMQCISSVDPSPLIAESSSNGE